MKACVSLWKVRFGDRFLLRNCVNVKPQYEDNEAWKGVRRFPGATVYFSTVQDEQRPEIIRGSEVMDDRANGKRRESA